MGHLMMLTLVGCHAVESMPVTSRTSERLVLTPSDTKIYNKVIVHHQQSDGAEWPWKHRDILCKHVTRNSYCFTMSRYSMN